VKGVIFNVVQEVVEEHFGAEFWDRAVEHSGVDGSYTSLGSYDDGDMIALVGSIAELGRVGREDVLVLAGRSGFRHLASRHRELLGEASGWRDVLHQLDGIIHPEVRKIYPDAEVPTFDATDVPGTPDTGDTVVLEYRSARHLCRLAEGLILGLGDWYDSAVTVEHLACVHRGDDGCRISVSGSPGGVAVGAEGS
jgi:hypothetical protein